MSFARCKALILLTFSFFLCQFIYSNSKSGEKRNNFSYIKYTHNFEFRSGTNKNIYLVKKRIKMIENVPDAVQKIMDKLTPITIVFFNGCLTDNPEFINQKGSLPRGYSYSESSFDKIMMCHKCGKIYLGIEGDYDEQLSDHTLHEYGHAYDDAIGNYFYKKPLSSLELVTNAIELSKTYLDSYYYNPREFIAYCVEQYYFSDHTRNKLKKMIRPMYDLLNELEVKCSEITD